MRPSLSIEQALKEQGELMRPVDGDSMMPLLDQRTDLVKIIPVHGELKQYDLPLYRRPSGALVLHRIIKVKKKHYVICGDNRQIYEKVPKEWVIGLAAGRYRGDDYLSFDDGEYRLNIEDLWRMKDRLPNRVRAHAQLVFLPRSQMKKRYPIINRAPILLPFCHIVRWVSGAAKGIKRRFK